MSFPQWAGLLKWSLGYSDGTQQSDFQAMSAENKAFLDEVMKSLVKDEAQRLNEILQSFMEIIERGIQTEDEDVILSQLEEVTDMTENIDMAQIFVKFGGIRALGAMIECSNDNIVTSSANLLATLAQNNPPVQQSMWQQGIIEKLVAICMSTLSAMVCSKCLYGISCIVRGYSHAEDHFCAHYAATLLPHALQTKHTAFVRRALFLSSSLVASDSASPERISMIASAMIPGCFEYVLHDDVDARESALRLLLAVIATDTGRSVLKQHENTLQEVLRQRKETNCGADDDQNKHELGLVRELQEGLSA